MSDVEVKEVAEREMARHGVGCQIDVSRYTGATMVVQHCAKGCACHPAANAEDEEPLLGPVMTFDPPSAKPGKATFGGQADPGRASPAAEVPLQAPAMTFDRPRKR